MHIVGRIKLPPSAEVSNLYLHCNEAVIDFRPGVEEVVFHSGGMISTNTYFNSFYENFYAKYTNLESLYYWLRLAGEFQISVYRVDEQVRLISSEKVKSQATDFVKIKLPELNNGRIYIEILCLSEQGRFLEGLIATVENPRQTVSLAIITCTYKKEEYIKKTIQTIVQDKLLQTKTWKVFVVDNGQTLTAADFTDARVELITNRNVGGSGGFTRGLIEALKGEYDHFLFMDDDIELESESIYRLFGLYEYAKSDLAIAGSMLDLAKKHILHEAGLFYSKNPDTGEFKPFSITRLNHNLDIQNPANLNFSLSDELDCGGFYFFAFSRKLVEEIGLPLPLFVKMDDLEFCLRIKNSSSKLVTFPSICVWHETFFNKASLWDYYYYRNDLIAHAIHKPLGYIDAISYFTKQVIFSLLLFDYNHTEMLIKAFEDCIKGPNFLKSNVPEVLHQEVLALSKSHKTQTVRLNYSPSTEQEKTTASKLKKVISLLTLNGQLLPNFLTSDEDVFLWQTPDYAGQRSKAFAKKRVLIFKEENNCLFQNEIDKVAGIKLFTGWLKAITSSSIKWSSVCKEWKNASSELTSTGFWQQYLGLEKSN